MIFILKNLLTILIGLNRKWVEDQFRPILDEEGDESNLAFKERDWSEHSVGWFKIELNRIN